MNEPTLPPTATDSTACSYCSLPVSGLSATPCEAVYCCLGCRFAAAVTGETGDRGEMRWMATALGLSVFCTMNVVMMTMALWSYAANPQSAFEARLADFLRWGGLLFTAPVLLLLGRLLALNAWEQLRRWALSTDLLLLTGVVAAFAFSVVSTVRGSGHVYYEVACVILVLVTLGRWLEATGRLQASAALDDLEQLLPDEVRCLDSTGEMTVIPRTSVTVGQRLRVLPGERIPVDGRVIQGRGVVDEQFFTGESLPVEKQPGDPLLGGSLNLEGDLCFEVTTTAQEGALGRLVEAVRTARMRKGHFQVLADRWSSRFFPIIAVVSLVTLVVHGWRTDWETGVLTALSVVLIACPCALALATPLAIWTALGSAARRGVVFRSGEALERLAEVRAICWDKTGTLTTGTPQLRGVICAQHADRETIESAALTLTSGSTHIYSSVIHRDLAETPHHTEYCEVETIPGRGLRGTLPQLGTVLLGSPAFLEQAGFHTETALAQELARLGQEGLTWVLIGWQGRVQGAFLLEESLRLEARAALAECRQMQLHQAILTGDRRERAVRWESLLSIPVIAELLPEQKLARIQEQHQLYGRVAMVGDGLNDAPALATADLGIALGCGADVTRDSADLCLLPNDLRLVPWSFDLARRTVHTIRQNLAWSFGYNSLGVVIAAFGWLHPAVAAVLMVVSSLMVLGNSLRLRGDSEFHDAASRSLPELPVSPSREVLS